MRPRFLSVWCMYYIQLCTDRCGNYYSDPLDHVFILPIQCELLAEIITMIIEKLIEVTNRRMTLTARKVQEAKWNKKRRRRLPLWLAKRLPVHLRPNPKRRESWHLPIILDISYFFNLHLTLPAQPCLGAHCQPPSKQRHPSGNVPK
jgi:hypothetical protein